jgi:hypothetical protein
MARAFVPNQEIVGTTTVAKNQTNFSMAGWIRRITSGSRQFFGFAQTASNWLGIFPFSDNSYYILNSINSSTFAVVGANITGWNHYAFTFDGSQPTNSGKLKGYVNGVAQTLTFTGNQPATTSNSADLETFKIGKRETSAFWSTGDFAELGMWQATLTPEEVASLAKGMTCNKVRPQSLVYYTPLIRDIQDLARGMTLTNTNSTVANHPRIYP